MSLQAFGPRGDTNVFNCSQVASTPVQLGLSQSNYYTYQFVNTGTKRAYMAWGADDSNLAVAPSANTPTKTIVILPNEIVIYNLVPNAYFSFVCLNAEETTVEVIVGEGM